MVAVPRRREDQIGDDTVRSRTVGGPAAPVSPGPTAVAGLAALQRLIGNRAVASMVVQRGVDDGSPGDDTGTPPAAANPPDRTCTYDPGEKEASRKSEGAVEAINDHEFLLTDFTPGAFELKPLHRAFLTKLFEERGLANPFADERVDAVGSTDCVSEQIAADNRLRFARATAAIAFLNFMGALDGRTGAARDPLARITSNADAAGRARNRNARISVSKVPPEPRPDDPNKKKWPGLRPVPRMQTFLVRCTGGVSGGEVVAGEIIHLRVVDVDQGLEADYDYTGLGLGAGLSPISTSSPGRFTPVTVDNVALGSVATLESFAGSAGLLTAGGGESTVTVLDVGRGFGRVPLDGASLAPGMSGTVGVIQMRGEPNRHDPNSVGPDDGA